jgi:hypothetical protein
MVFLRVATKTEIEEEDDAVANANGGVDGLGFSL